MNDIQKFLKQTTKTDSYEWGDNETHHFQKMRPRIYCKNGEHVSIQASETHYCSPRINGANNYYEIEAGFPSVVPPISWKPFAEEWDNRPISKELKTIWRSFFGKYRSAFSRRIASKRIFNPMPTQTVYAWMPTKITQEFLDAHGGIDWERTFKEKE